MRHIVTGIAAAGFAAVFAGALAGASTGPAVAGPAVGELRCSVAGAFGYIVASSRRLTCTYYRPDGAVEFYTGTTGRVGIDMGPTNALRVAYRVIVSDPRMPRALEGDFAGLGAGYTAGSGLGADALVNGHGVTLEPLANQNLTGLNMNGGLALMRLAYAGMERSRY